MPPSVKCRAFVIAVSLSCAAAIPAFGQASTVGQWAGPYAWPLVTVHATLMPNGKVLLYDDHTDNAGVQVWDPVLDTLVDRPYVNEDLFCSGHTVRPDGRVLVLGGTESTLVGLIRLATRNSARA